MYREIFRKSYIELIKKIMLYCSNIIIVSSTPCVKKENLKVWDDFRNAELKERNEISKDTADKFGFPYIDIWTPLINTHYEYRDYIHIGDEGNDFIADYLYKFLCKCEKLHIL